MAVASAVAVAAVADVADVAAVAAVAMFMTNMLIAHYHIGNISKKMHFFLDTHPGQGPTGSQPSPAGRIQRSKK